MKKYIRLYFFLALILSLPAIGNAQVDTSKKAVDTTFKVKSDSIPKDTVQIVDTVQIAVAPKDCFTEWYEKFRQRGALAVKDGVQPVIITLKSETGAVCLMGKIEVAGGRLKPPLMVQQENGEYKAFNAMGKKLDPAFESTLGPEQLYGIVDGMSIVFRTNNQEYGRLIFYTFVNKGGKENKAAPSPADLMKE